MKSPYYKKRHYSLMKSTYIEGLLPFFEHNKLSVVMWSGFDHQLDYHSCHFEDNSIFPAALVSGISVWIKNAFGMPFVITSHPSLASTIAVRNNASVDTVGLAG
jgi:hypothetical protein